MKDTRYRLDPLVYAPLLGLRGKQTAVQDDVIQFKTSENLVCECSDVEPLTLYSTTVLTAPRRGDRGPAGKKRGEMYHVF